jgi:hypothetical protein
VGAALGLGVAVTRGTAVGAAGWGM